MIEDILQLLIEHNPVSWKDFVDDIVHHHFPFPKGEVWSPEYYKLLYFACMDRVAQNPELYSEAFAILTGSQVEK